MVVKILSSGKLPSDRVYECVCPYCKCEFSFQAADATLIPDQRDGDALKIDCPTCKTPVYKAK